MATRPRKPTTEIQAQWTPPQQRASSTARPSSPQWPRPPSADGDYEHYEAHWGTIFLVLCALPGTLFVLANPVSLFIEGWLLFMAILATFVPKVVYFIMLEYAILNGNGSVFFHLNHTKRMSESSRFSRYILSQHTFLVRVCQLKSRSSAVLADQEAAPDTLFDQFDHLAKKRF